ncbi:hypothetical protein CH76_12590 [Lysinibacillus sp. BF-4]|uniref:CidA/LrgA family protein n=1 Tax=Lysinibacillus sp. BF-4 TaxID=1473546 RepID=UPI000500ADDA|nr:CidA/LrgA family protein [Lysinibacillus sp. BF-4]KFL42417.1 hypothetical protein CH76_12590 [Lysinibacillus sp. BF-4]
MRVVRIVVQIAILYVFYLVGTFIVTQTGLPLPGSIIGLILLSLCLQMKWINVKAIQDGSSFLIGVLTIFFVPATVGIVEYPQLLSSAGAKLIIAVMISTLFTIYATGRFSQYVERKTKKDGEVQ